MTSSRMLLTVALLQCLYVAATATLVTSPDDEFFNIIHTILVDVTMTQLDINRGQSQSQALKMLQRSR